MPLLDLQGNASSGDLHSRLLLDGAFVNQLSVIQFYTELSQREGGGGGGKGQNTPQSSIPDRPMPDTVKPLLNVQQMPPFLPSHRLGPCCLVVG